MATKYRELIVKGDDKLLKGFLEGFQIANKIEDGLVFCRDNPINTGHLKEILTFHADYVHLVTSTRHHDSLIAAIDETDDLELVSDKPVSRSSFKFEFETFNREVANTIRAALAKPPGGLKMVDYKPEEQIDPDAKGPEMYSPVHEYRFCGSGTVEGDIEKLLAYHHQLDDNEFIDAEDITLEH